MEGHVEARRPAARGRRRSWRSQSRPAVKARAQRAPPRLRDRRDGARCAPPRADGRGRRPPASHLGEGTGRGEQAVGGRQPRAARSARHARSAGAGRRRARPTTSRRRNGTRPRRGRRRRRAPGPGCGDGRDPHRISQARRAMAAAACVTSAGRRRSSRAAIRSAGCGRRWPPRHGRAPRRRAPAHQGQRHGEPAPAQPSGEFEAVLPDPPRASVVIRIGSGSLSPASAARLQLRQRQGTLLPGCR